MVLPTADNPVAVVASPFTLRTEANHKMRSLTPISMQACIRTSRVFMERLVAYSFHFHHVTPLMPVSCQNYPKPSYQIYAQPDRLSRHLSGRCSSGCRPSVPDAHLVYRLLAYDDTAIHDPYYPEERRISPGPYNTAVSHSGIPHRQRRRSSSVSFDMRAPSMDTFNRRLSSRIIKLKRKGAFRSGLTIGDAQANARLSGNDSYTFRDFNTNNRGRIALIIRVSVIYLGSG